MRRVLANMFSLHTNGSTAGLLIVPSIRANKRLLSALLPHGTAPGQRLHELFAQPSRGQVTATDKKAMVSQPPASTGALSTSEI